MDSVIREKLVQLTSKADSLAKHGKYIECIDIMEEIVSLKKNIYGITHPEFQKASEKLCEFLNLAAMIHLQKQQFESSLECLKKAQIAARNSLQFKATTFNNLACYYRRIGKTRTALTYLTQTLELELKTERPKTLADTHLNLCAVLSQLNRHEDALQHIMLSVILLQDQFLQISLPYMLGNEGEGQQLNDERLAVLAISYHNLGVQFQHLKRFQQASKIYKKAFNLSQQYLKNNEQLNQKLSKVVSSASEQIQNQKKSHQESRRQKYERQMSEGKKQLYKELAKNNQKMKNLPKLRINKDSFTISSTSNVQSLNKTSYDKNMPKHNERHSASRKNPRYYKSFAVTINHDSRRYADPQIPSKFTRTGDYKQ